MNLMQKLIGHQSKLTDLALILFVCVMVLVYKTNKI